MVVFGFIDCVIGLPIENVMNLNIILLNRACVDLSCTGINYLTVYHKHNIQLYTWRVEQENNTRTD